MKDKRGNEIEIGKPACYCGGGNGAAPTIHFGTVAAFTPKSVKFRNPDHKPDRSWSKEFIFKSPDKVMMITWDMFDPQDIVKERLKTRKG